MARAFSRFCLHVVATTLAISPCLAEEEAPSAESALIREEVDVRLSTFEVSVVDPEGRPVFGLEEDDFEVFRDGQPIEILAFEAPVPPAEEPRDPLEAELRGPPSRQPGGLNLVLCVDSTFLVTGDLDRLVEPVRTFLHMTLAPGGRAMLLDCHSEPKIRVALTASADSVADGLADLAGELHTTRLSSEYRSILQELEQVQGRGSPRLAPMNREAAPQFFKARIDSFSGQAKQELDSAARRLSIATLSIAGLPGTNELLYVSGRPPQSSAAALYDAWKNAFGSTSGYNESNRASPGAGLSEEGVGMIEFDSSDIRPIDSGAMDPYNSAAVQAALRDVRIHTLEAGGLVDPSALVTTQAGGDTSLAGAGSSFSTSLDADQGLADRQILSEVAEVSGGQSLVVPRGAAADLLRLSALLRAYYTFVLPTRPTPDRIFHEPTLRLKEPDATASLRYRRFYRERSLDEVAGDEAVSALLLGLGENPLEARLAAGPSRRVSRRTVALPLSVRVPFAGLALVPEGKAHTGSLSLFFVFAGPDRVPSPVQKAVVPVRVGNSDLLTSLGRQVEYSVDLDVPSDARRVAVAVRDDVASSTSTASLDIAPVPKRGGRTDRGPG